MAPTERHRGHGEPRVTSPIGQTQPAAADGPASSEARNDDPPRVASLYAPGGPLPTYRKKQESYWRVPPNLFLRGWTEPGCLLAFYVMSNNWRTTEGLYRLPKALIRSDLRWSARRLKAPLEELITCAFIEYDSDSEVVLLVEALRYQNTANDNMCKGAVRKLRLLPPTPLFDSLLRVCVDYDLRLARALLFAMPERFTEDARYRAETVCRNG